MVSKRLVVDALLESLRRDLDAVEAAARAAHDAATHPEAKPENEKDTRALEAGYLAGAQSARAAELQQAVAVVEKAKPESFALLTIEEDVRGKATRLLLLLSRVGGGQKLVVDGQAVQVVTPQSPLGMALEGAAAGADVDVDMGSRVRSLRVVERT